jgi:hypothetical protein
MCASRSDAPSNRWNFPLKIPEGSYHMRLDDLHDSILKSININVEEGSIEMRLAPVGFDGASERIALTARNFEHFVLPRKLPWGRKGLRSVLNSNVWKSRCKAAI